MRKRVSLSGSDDGFAPAGFDAFEFCNAIESYELNRKLDRQSGFSQQGKMELDAQGGAI